jgi:hypothetical protein
MGLGTAYREYHPGGILALIWVYSGLLKISAMILSRNLYVKKLNSHFRILKIKWWQWRLLLPKVNLVDSSDISAVKDLKGSDF